MNLWTIATWSFSSIVILHLMWRLYQVAHRARLRPRGEIHRPSLFRHMIVSYAIIFLAAALESRWGFWTRRPLVSLAGALLYGLSSWLQWRALADLGAAYSPDIEVRSDQSLVRHGLYGWIRHPLLTAGTVEMVSIPLFFNAYGSVLFALALFVPVIGHRWREEEKVLLGHFGKAYETYRQEVGAFFPRLVRG